MARILTPTIVAVLLFAGAATVFPQVAFQALHLGADAQMVSLLLVTDIAAMLALGPVVGVLADRCGPKLVIVLALSFSPIAFWILVGADSLTDMFVSRLLMGVSLAVRPVLQSCVVAQARSGERVSGLAGINGAYALAFVIGPLIASFGLGPAGNAFDGVALVAFVTSLVALLFAMVALPSHVRTQVPMRTAPSARQTRIASRGLFTAAGSAMIAIQVLLSFVFAAMAATIGVWSSTRLGWDARDLAYAFAAAGAFAAATQFAFVGILAARVGERALTLASVAFMLVGFLLLALAPSSFNAAIAIVLLGVGSATSLSCLQSVSSLYASRRTLGSLFGVTLSLNSLARITGPLWGGYCLAHFGPSAPYLSGVVVVVGAALLIGRIPALGWRRIEPASLGPAE